MSKTARFYKKEFPDVGDNVMVRVRESTEYGYNVTLLEYNGLDGFITLANMSRKSRHKSLLLAKIGEEFPVSVIATEPKKKIVNLSKRFLDAEDVKHAVNQYKYKLQMHRMGFEIFNLYNTYLKQKGDDQVTLEDVLDNTSWYMIDETKEGEDNFYEMMYINLLNNPKLIINETKFPKEFVDKMLDNFRSRTVLNHTEMEMLVKILIVAKEGVDDLKHVLDILNISLDHPPEYKINIVPMSSPIYKLYVSGPEDKICREIINSLAKKVKNRVKGKGTFKIHHEPYVLRQTVQSFKFIPSQELSTLVL